MISFFDFQKKIELVKYLKIKSIVSIIEASHYNLVYSNMSNLTQNNRFDCLKSSSSPRDERSYRRHDSNRRSTFDGNRGSYFRRTDRRQPERQSESTLFNLNNNSFGNYLNIPGVENSSGAYVTPAQRNKDRYTFARRPVNEETAVDKKPRFPTLPNLKKNLKKNNETTIDYTNVKTAEAIIKKKEEKPATFETLPKGWIKLKKKSPVSNLEKTNEEGQEESETPPPYNDEQFQHECSVACWHTIHHIQHYRDEHIKTFGAMSPYYGKNSLTNLNYISDSDIEYSDSDDDEKHNSEDDYYDDDY